MAIVDLLQDFGTAIPDAEPVKLVRDSEWEEKRVADYERGYAAGWEDAQDLQARERTNLGKALRSNLEDLNFTFAEAHQQMLGSVTPVFEAIVERVLPDIMVSAIGPLIVGELMQMIEPSGAISADICVAPGQGDKVRPIVEQVTGGRASVIEDPGLTADEARLRVGDSERIVDTGNAIEGIRAALNGFAFETAMEVQHG